MSTVETRKRKYRVWLRSTPGFYAQYNGHVDVWSDGEDLFGDAVRELARTSFPDRRLRDFWRFERAEIVS